MIGLRRARGGAEVTMADRSPRIAKTTFAGAAFASVAFASASAAAQLAPYAPPGQYTPPPGAQPGQYVPRPYGQPAPFPQPYAPQPYSPAPYAPPPYTPHEDDSFTADRARSWPILRASLGAGLGAGHGTGIKLGFDLDVTAGYRLVVTRRVLIAFEGSYSLDTEPTLGGHLAAIGAGPELYAGRYIGIGWMPKLVLGGTWQGLGVGVRNTLVVPFLLHVVSLEIGHQWLRVEGRDQHEVRAQIGVDLAALGYAWAWLVVASIH
jgi:hypothetical protein